MSDRVVESTENKIHDSKGKLYYVCPFLDKIQVTLGEAFYNKEPLTEGQLFEITRHHESIRTIARYLRGEDNDCGELNAEMIYKPYNFDAVLKNIRISLKIGSLTEEKLEEIIKQYL